MGWNQVRFNRHSPVTQKVTNHSFFYFVHSYYANPEDKRMIVGETDYGIPFPSILARSHVFGVQFHPEKSQCAGLQVLKNFIGFKHVDHSGH
jgi:glutamine amidotransferase